MKWHRKDDGRKIDRARGGTDSKLHAAADDRGRLPRMALTVGQRSDYTGARELADDLPKAKHTVADRGQTRAGFEKTP